MEDIDKPWNEAYVVRNRLTVTELKKTKESLVKEYMASVKTGIIDVNLQQKIEDINEEIKKFNMWSLK